MKHKKNIKDYLKTGVFIIAEAGVNHNKDLAIAFKLVDAAKAAGADAVKFQTFITDRSITKHSELAEYQKAKLSQADTQYDMAKRLELSFDDFRRIKKYCDDRKIMFLSSPDEVESLDFLCSLNIPIIKLGSGEITNYPLLRQAAKYGRPLVLSTGMCDLVEIKAALKVIYKAGSRDMALLHCVTEYPAPVNEVNLRAMITMKNKFRLPIGYSDHTVGMEVSIAAVALGAQIIEKHFTLDKNLSGPDHSASLEPFELKEMVKAIRNVEKSLGNGVKTPAACEQKNISIVRRGVVARCKIEIGKKIVWDDIILKKPGYGIQPMEMKKIIGKKARKTIAQDEHLTWEMLK